jgi:hypothetical protein
MIIEMGDKVPPVCSTKELKRKGSSSCIKWTRSLNTSLVMISILLVLVCFSLGIFIIYYCSPCDSTKQASSGDLTSTSNITCFQSQTPAQAVNIFNMCNITFVGNNSHLQHTILQGIFDFLWTIEEINKSLPPSSEGGVIMFCKDLLTVVQQLQYDVQKAVKYVKKLQESLKPKHRRRPPPQFKI